MMKTSAVLGIAGGAISLAAVKEAQLRMALEISAGYSF
jgi:hypothetical protein